MSLMVKLPVLPEVPVQLVKDAILVIKFWALSVAPAATQPLSVPVVITPVWVTTPEMMSALVLSEILP